MPKRTDLETILLIGAGPIVIGQACEFDYSGTQACKALKNEGYRVVLLNSNPATIMTDPEFADRTYVEPVTVEVLERIIAKERPQALLPTLGGQTALNTAVAAARAGVLERYQVELIGASLEAIEKAEDRTLFKRAMENIGVEVPASGLAHSMEEALEIVEEVGFPAIIRPSYTLGGSGGGIAYNHEEYRRLAHLGLDASPINEILVEESVIGWKEFELEVMRDKADNVVIICSIENMDPMGVHTGDSYTVAPAQTLTDKEYQRLRNASLRIIREIGVDTGGSNIQFGVNPHSGRIVVIEMNPRVSRSSALASKATGFPIAKIAAKLAVGYTLDEIPNDITQETLASFEPTIDYVVTKAPRFTFEKFSQADSTLTTQMKSVGEAMSIGRTFKESLQKALRSLEIDSYGLESRIFDENVWPRTKLSPSNQDTLDAKLQVPNWERIWYIADALRGEYSVAQIAQVTGMDPWFLQPIAELVALEDQLREYGLPAAENAEGRRLLARAKADGFSDRRLAQLWDCDEDTVYARRCDMGIHPVYKRVDTCAAEFEAHTPYLYSTYEQECEAAPSNKNKIMILGGGPNRIGQGIEFDYCCVHCSYALQRAGFETIMVNCNPETVSTDYDTSDRLYFDPLTREDVLEIVAKEKPQGVIIQFGGQTPLKLAVSLERYGVPIIGTPPDAIDRAEDRERFQELLYKLNLQQPENGLARSYQEAHQVAAQIGYPVVVRPSYVLGGRAMEIVYDADQLENYMQHAVAASPEHPVLIDKFLEDAIEVDVDAVADGEEVVIGGLMQHIEEAGIHSGDSACSLPPYNMERVLQDEIKRQTRMLALELGVIGLMNIQFAVQKGQVYLLEVNPRASRTVPYVSKATGQPLAKIAALVMTGTKLADLPEVKDRVPSHIAVKEAVFPFIKFPGVDTLLGPEMKSTGEVMGLDVSFGQAFAKAQLAAGVKLPTSGTIFISVRDADKSAALPLAERFREMGFSLVATRGTATFLQEAGIEVTPINKVKEGRPHCVDAIKNHDIHMVFNTTFGVQSVIDSYSIRRTALVYDVAYFTTVAGMRAAVAGLDALQREGLDVTPLQEYHATDIPQL